jgi:hypothetical protein
VLPTATCPHTTPLIWAVGNASADTVTGLAEPGTGGLESACAGAVGATTAPTAAIIAVNAVRFHFARNRMFARLAAQYGTPIPETVATS